MEINSRPGPASRALPEAAAARVGRTAADRPPGESSLEGLKERGSLGSLQLIEGAVPRILVRAPALEASAVPEAIAGELVVADLDHQHRRDGDEGQVLVAAPAAGSAGSAGVLPESALGAISGADAPGARRREPRPSAPARSPG